MTERERAVMDGYRIQRNEVVRESSVLGLGRRAAVGEMFCIFNQCHQAAVAETMREQNYRLKMRSDACVHSQSPSEIKT